MVQRILIATRKGLFIASSKNTSWKIEELGFMGDPTVITPNHRELEIADV